MKQIIKHYIKRCDIYQQTKTKTQSLEELLQLLLISKQNWINITMNFAVDLLETARGKSSIFVVSKQAYFILSQNTALLLQLYNYF
jgi:hypothetical protein